MSRKLIIGTALKKYVRRYTLNDKLNSITSILGEEAQSVIDWAYTEAKRRIAKNPEEKESDLGKIVFELISNEAAIILVKQNYAKGRLTTKSEVKAKTGKKAEMPVLYREAGLRHPQEARNLRHNIFHEAFQALIMRLFPGVTTSVPSTGEGLTPDLIVENKDQNWLISVEYKGYRSITLLSESEVLKGMRYQAIYGTAWLVTSTTKSVKDLYGKMVSSKDVINNGLSRLKRINRRRAYTIEQRENRGIARKGITHLEKQSDLDMRCRIWSVEELLESMKIGKPVKGLIITTGFEFIDLLKSAGLDEEADNVLRVMKLPTASLHSDKVTSVRLIE
ncbi:MAG: hypothetical protein AM326_11855 [Candidatus Thorarchaeota archaeon SMTZ-45]|nr:MAG: hypothetical protein AM326_11855 [Candidatus Thorarchaeota archaeon SMTZ-45]KXH74216.1 MAG: hypothetical protein AM325_06375 [Candidatus Thorarchaeota archaeon SMTZ1-45]